MSTSADITPDRAAAPEEDAPHLFDQTNGVLGAEQDGDPGERRRGDTRTPPTSFGVPPVVSL